MSSGNQASVLGHGVEGALLVTEQISWSVILDDAASIQHHYTGEEECHVVKIGWKALVETMRRK